MEECVSAAINPDWVRREDERNVCTSTIKGGQVPSIVGFHGDTDLSSIRRIKLSVPAHVSPLPIISSHPVYSIHSMTHCPMSFLCGSKAAVARTVEVHWWDQRQFQWEEGIY